MIVFTICESALDCSYHYILERRDELITTSVIWDPLSRLFWSSSLTLSSGSFSGLIVRAKRHDRDYYMVKGAALSVLVPWLCKLWIWKFGDWNQWITYSRLDFCDVKFSSKFYCTELVNHWIATMLWNVVFGKVLLHPSMQAGCCWIISIIPSHQPCP